MDFVVENFELVWMWTRVDAASEGLLAFDHFLADLDGGMEVAGKRHRFIMVMQICKAHSGGRVSADCLLDKNGLNVLNPLFCMSHLMAIGSYFDDLKATVEDIAMAKFDGVQTTGPDRGVQDTNAAAVRMCCPNELNETDQLAANELGKQAFSSGWENREVITHICRLDEHGQPCCRTEAEARQLMRKAIKAFFFLVLPPILCATRWLTCAPCLGWWLKGMLCHSLFQQAFALMYRKVVEDFRLKEQRRVLKGKGRGRGRGGGKGKT